MAEVKTARKSATAVAPRKPSRLERKLGHLAKKSAAATWPYAVALALGALAGFALHSAAVTWLVIGGVLALAGQRLHEASGWHRRGGKAAARKRRKFQGTASRRERNRHLSVRAARKHAKITRPATTATTGKLAAVDAGVLIGKTGRPPHQLMGSHEDCYMAFAPQRGGKTGWLAGGLLDAPGAAIATSTRIDLWAYTVLERQRRGPVLVLNPELDGGVASTLFWNPLVNCEYPAGAIQAAGYLMAAAPRDPSGKDAWHDAQGARLLRWMMHAGALAGASIIEVQRWCEDPVGSTEPMAILTGYRDAAPGWSAELAGLLAHEDDPEFISGVSRSAVAALDWLSDPALAAAACPRDSWAGLDAEQFLASGGTVYLIGTDRPHSPLSPYFACFTAHLFDAAKRLAAASPGTRLDPPLTLVLDEPAITCPVPLDKWTAEAGGHGITIMTGFQSRSQLDARWGEIGARTIWNNATVKLIFGGFTDAVDLESFSAVCGDTDTWDIATDNSGGRSKNPRPQRLFPPERIRMLAQGKALVLHRRTRPLVASITPVWERPGYERADPATYTPLTTPAGPAIDGRQAIVLPPPVSEAHPHGPEEITS